jgi:hypothetical protein
MFQATKLAYTHCTLAELQPTWVIFLFSVHIDIYSIYLEKIQENIHFKKNFLKFLSFHGT